MKRSHLHPPAAPTAAWPLAVALLLAACSPAGMWAEPAAVTTLSVPRALFASWGLSWLEVGVFRQDNGQRIVFRTADVSSMTEDQITFSLSVPAGVPLAFRANAGDTNENLDCLEVCGLSARTDVVLAAGRNEPVELFLYWPDAGFDSVLPGRIGGSDAAFAVGFSYGVFAPDAGAMGAEFFDLSQAGLLAAAPENGDAPVLTGWADYPGAEAGLPQIWLAVYDTAAHCSAGSYCDAYLNGRLADDLGWSFDPCQDTRAGCYGSFLAGASQERYLARAERSGGRVRVTLTLGEEPTGEFTPEAAMVLYRDREGRQLAGALELAGLKEVIAQATTQGYDPATGEFTFDLPDRGAGRLQIVTITQEQFFGGVSESVAALIEVELP